MAHSLSSYSCPCYLNAAAVTYFALEAYLLELSAVTLPVLCWSENSLAEKTVALRLLGSVIYSFRSFNCAVRPASDLLGGRKTYLYRFKSCKFQTATSYKLYAQRTVREPEASGRRLHFTDYLLVLVRGVVEVEEEVLVIVIAGILVRRTAKATAKAARGRGPMILAALVAVLLTALSADSILRVLRDVMGLSDQEAWGFFAALDLAVLASAVLARHRRRLIAQQGGDATIPVDGVAVWVIAALEGVVGSWSQTSVEGTLIRGFAPLLAAWLYERALALEVAEIRGVSRATLSRVGAGLTATWQQVKRILARWGIISTSDQTIADVHWSRWARRVSRAAYRVERIPATATDRDRLVATATARVDRLVSGMQQRGLLDRPIDRQRLIDRPTDRRMIVAALLGQPVDRPTDRPTEPRSTDGGPDRPPVDLIGRPPGRPTGVAVYPPNNPTVPTIPTDPANGNRTQAASEALIKSALVRILSVEGPGADFVTVPPQKVIADIATELDNGRTLSKSTVGGYLSRYNIHGQLTWRDMESLPGHIITIEENPS